MCTARVQSQALTISSECRAFIEYLDSRKIYQSPHRATSSVHPVYVLDEDERSSLHLCFVASFQGLITLDLLLSSLE